MQVRDGMSSLVLTVGPNHKLSEAARLMAERKVGAAAVIDPDLPGPGILTERDILHAIAAGQDPAQELVGEHLTNELIVASPDWSLEQAAEAMVEGGVPPPAVATSFATPPSFPAGAIRPARRRSATRSNTQRCSL